MCIRDSFIAAPPLVRTIFRLPKPGALKARTSADPVTQPLAAGVAASTTATADGTAHAPAGATGDGAGLADAEDPLEADERDVSATPPDSGPPLGSHPTADDLQQDERARGRAAEGGEQL